MTGIDFRLVDGMSGLAASIGTRPAGTGADPGSHGDRAAMKQAGIAFEAAFLTEMLRHSGLSSLRGQAGGAMAEGQLAPMMARALAERMAADGGLGIAALVTARLAEAAGAATAADLPAPVGTSSPLRR